MAKYKLYYFNIRGRGEPIRQLFALAGQQFEDKRISRDEWPQIKDDMPFGQVPVLEYDNVKIAQSLAIGRFLGRKFHLMGKDEIENAKLDMLADSMNDAMVSDAFKQWSRALLGWVEIDKEQFFKEKVMSAIEPYVQHVEEQLLGNNNGLLLGEKETWVDVYVAEFFSKLIDFGAADALAAYPHIMQFVERIHNIPAICEHIKNRPATCI